MLMPLLLCIFLAPSQLLPSFLCADTSCTVAIPEIVLIWSKHFSWGVLLDTCPICVGASADAVEWDMACTACFLCSWSSPCQVDCPGIMVVLFEVDRSGQGLGLSFTTSTRFVLEQKMHSN